MLGSGARRRRGVVTRGGFPLHSYVATHSGPIPEAPNTLSTLVVPTDPGPDVARALLAPGRLPILALRSFALDFPPVSPDPAAAVQQIADRYRDCERCHLSDRRTRIAHIKGNPYAAVVCLGEGPGKDEDIQGVPFVGRSGQLQDALFAESGIRPLEDMAWINLVGCRPCENRHAPDRVPTLVEKIACAERTLMLLRALRPRVVLCLGEQATSMFFEEAPNPNSWATLTPPDDPRDAVVVGVVRHPAYLLRTIGMQNTYREYAAARLFYRGFRGMLPGLQKVASWRFGLRYLAALTGPLIGPALEGGS
jgi:uracil-DNA glycosylase